MQGAASKGGGLVLGEVADPTSGSGQVVEGVWAHAEAIEPFMAVTEEIEFRFSFGHRPAEFAATLGRLGLGGPGADFLVTSSVGLGGLPDAFDALRTPGEHGKIMVDPHREESPA